ncbi:2680_t:CDS:2 [Cetraspora pellucida]|uniref:2680_t:CDS:1 n=1 Tax=Cetraspora pellucida TaxID=1433469 RepID=A0A9N9G243_9GLOM|nr:2680_t:CDS:2 [Cetraspora pellucida]
MSPSDTITPMVDTGYPTQVTNCYLFNTQMYMYNTVESTIWKFIEIDNLEYLLKSTI